MHKPLTLTNYEVWIMDRLNYRQKCVITCLQEDGKGAVLFCSSLFETSHS